MNKENNQNLPFIPDWFARSIDKWIEKKTHNKLTHYQITRHNIYILPTKAGWLFILTLIAILSGAINYNNNMAYLLCFFLASLGFIAMLQTHQNINGLVINADHSPSVFCGKLVEFNFYISTKINHHYSIYTANNDHCLSVNKELKPNFTVSEATKKRGRQNPSRFKIFSEFPLGLFYAWTQVKISNPVIIYPKPIKNNSNIMEFASGNTQQENITGDDDYAGIRNFIKGDSPKKMAWKMIAKTKKLYTKEFHTESGEFLMFDFNKLDKITNTEEKLSILCGLILNAHNQKKNYGLKLPTKTIQANYGDQHKHQCLSLLALYQT